VPLFGAFNPLSPEWNGWHIYSVTGNITYYSVGLPDGSGSLPSSLSQQPVWGAGAEGALGWSSVRDRSAAALEYVASYQAQSGYTGFQAFNQSLSADWQRKLGERWSLSLVANAALATRDQYLYALTAPSTTTPVSAGFTDLMRWPVGGQYANTPVFPASETPTADLLEETLFGTRLFASQFTSGLTYLQSARLAWNFTAVGLRIQGLSDGANPVQSAGLLTASTSVSANLRLRYLLTPRSMLNFGVEEMRTVSRIEDIYVLRTTVGITHTFSRRWSADVYGGGSQLSPLRLTYPLSSDFGYIAGGTLEFHSYSHTLLGSVNRQMGDAYGLGALNSLTSKASWTWRRPGNPWALQTIFLWQKLNQGVNIDNWSVTGAVNRAFNDHFTGQLAYVYLALSQSSLPGVLTTSGVVPNQSSVRASLTWYPREIHQIR
jgi:hypothetical protein